MSDGIDLVAEALREMLRDNSEASREQFVSAFCEHLHLDEDVAGILLEGLER